MRLNGSVAGTFYEFPRQPDGAEVPLNCMRFGNVLVRADLVRAERVPFDPSYGLTSGEDADFLVRLVHKGARVVWSEKAPVSEPVEPKRLTLKYLLARAMSGGQGFARYTLSGSYGPISFLGRTMFVCQAILYLLVAIVVAVLSIPLGRHRAAAMGAESEREFRKAVRALGLGLSAICADPYARHRVQLRPDGFFNALSAWQPSRKLSTFFSKHVAACVQLTPVEPGRPSRRHCCQINWVTTSASTLSPLRGWPYAFLQWRRGSGSAERALCTGLIEGVELF